jgi:hypothetical protein
MTAPMRPSLLPLVGTATALLLSGCAADTTNYPSLARRDAERVTGSADVVPAQQAAPLPSPQPSADLSARLAQLTTEAETAHRAFLASRGRTEQLVTAARGAAVASENWSVATVALADLEASRSRAMVALADLDSLYAAERVNGGTAEAVGAARDQVIALVGQEDTVLAELRGRIAG